MAESKHLVLCFGSAVDVTVTSSPSAAHKWISTTVSLLQNHPGHMVVGVGVQWTPSFSGEYAPADTIQLCALDRCLIFQLSSARAVPGLLRGFLLDRSYCFVGIWNSGDARRLMASRHRLEVQKLLDLRICAANEYGDRRLLRAPVERIVEACLGYKAVRMKKQISMSRWNADRLSVAQVSQACVKAHVSFLMGVELRLGPVNISAVPLDLNFV